MRGCTATAAVTAVPMAADMSRIMAAVGMVMPGMTEVITVAAATGEIITDGIGSFL
jgi:hypothetical protein